MKKNYPKNHKDLFWREYPKVKPTAENGDYLCLRKLSKRSKYVDIVKEYYSNTQYPTYNFSKVSDQLWSRCNKHSKTGGPVVAWMPYPDVN